MVAMEFYYSLIVVRTVALDYIEYKEERKK